MFIRVPMSAFLFSLSLTMFPLSTAARADGAVPGGTPSDGTAKILKIERAGITVDQQQSAQAGFGVNQDGTISGDARLHLESDSIVFGGTKSGSHCVSYYYGCERYSVAEQYHSQGGLIGLPLEVTARARAGADGLEKGEVSGSLISGGGYRLQAYDLTETAELDPTATFRFDGLKAGVLASTDKVTKMSELVANVDLVDLSGHVAFSANGVPIELCGRVAPGLRAGVASHNGSELAAYNPGKISAMVCGGFSAGKIAHVRDTFSFDGELDLFDGADDYRTKIVNDLSVSKILESPFGVFYTVEGESTKLNGQTGVVRHTMGVRAAF